MLTLTKDQCRIGLEAEDRRLVWYLLATAPCDGTVPSEPVRTFAVDASLTSQLSRSASRYQHALREVFGNVGVPKRCFRLPFLGVEPSVLPEGKHSKLLAPTCIRDCTVPLALSVADATVLLTQPSIAESAAHDRVISTLAQLHGLRYCPQVPNLALIMLSYLSEAEVFTAMVCFKSPSVSEVTQ